jgi:hypothetical protein
MNADELLLALSEEWGDKEKAAERRAEIEKRKQEAILKAENDQRKGHLRSLSVMRGALKSLKSGPNSKDYQNRMEKIKNIESALKNNPTFTRHDLLENNDPFLYNQEMDQVFRAGDILFTRSEGYTVESLNFKKQELIVRELMTGAERKKKNDYYTRTYGTKYNDMSILKVPRLTDGSVEWSYNNTCIGYHAEKPGAEERDAMTLVNQQAFYAIKDKAVKEKYYPLHVRLVKGRYDAYETVLFYDNAGKLEIKLSRSYDNDTEKKLLNPFSTDGIQAIREGLKNEVTFNDYLKDELLEKAGELFPDLYSRVSAALNREREKADTEDALNDAGEETEETKTEAEIGEVTAGNQLEKMFREAAASGKFPWNDQVDGKITETPFNPVTGEYFTGNNLIAAALHKSKINSADPRYLSRDEIEQSGYTLKDEAEPLTLCYRTNDGNGEYFVKTETVYNAGDVVNAPPYRPVSAMYPGACIRGEVKTSAASQLVEDMAAFMAAAKCGGTYVPAVSQFTKDDYHFARSLNADQLFTVIQRAEDLSGRLLKRETAKESETEKRAVGMSL